MRLLIVDDEPSILELLGVALKALGTYKVKTATSAKQALQMIEDKPREFDAFLLDVQMPNMNGIDLCAEIRRNELYRNAPILMLTAMSQMSYVEKAFEAGATDYVTKPFNFEDLKQRLNTARKLKYSNTAASATAAEATPAMMRSIFYHENLDYSSELDFSKVKRFIGVAEFDNYVRQMAMSKAAHTCAFALRIANGDQISAKSASIDFYNVFHKIAVALSDATEENGSLLTYRGNGIFLCAEHGRRLTDTESLERRIAQMASTMDCKGPCPEIAVGANVEMEATNSDSGRRLLDAAIAKAQERAPYSIAPMPQVQAVAPSAPKSVAAAQLQMRRPATPEPVASPKARPDRKAYEQMLLDSLRNG
ncbi:MAG: response regulator [Pseudooceanicola sp.]